MSNRMILNETAYFGKDAVKQLTAELKNRSLERVLVVTDAELVKCKVAAKVTKLLIASRIIYQIYDKVRANPTIRTVNDGLEMARQFRADVIVAVGGGSVIDTAKAIAVLMANPEITDVRRLEGISPTKRKAVPLFAITTTSGTAAEVTIIMSLQMRTSSVSLCALMYMIFRLSQSLTRIFLPPCLQNYVLPRAWMRLSMRLKDMLRKVHGSSLTFTALRRLNL